MEAALVLGGVLAVLYFYSKSQQGSGAGGSPSTPPPSTPSGAGGNSAVQPNMFKSYVGQQHAEYYKQFSQ